MTAPTTRPDGPRTWGTLAVGALVLGGALYADAGSLRSLLTVHERTVLAFVLAVTAGELFRLRMPSGRMAAPLASASALATAFVGRIHGEPTFDVDAGFVVLVVAGGLLLAAAVRWVRGRAVEIDQVAARLVGVGVAAWLTRGLGPEGQSLWDLEIDRTVPLSVIACVMAVVAAVGVIVEIMLTAAVQSERQRTPWSAALRDEIGEVAPLTFAVVTTGPLVALMAPVLGLLALPTALFPLAITYVAVGRYARNRQTYRQTIATLSRLTEEGGYTPRHHAERVADLSVRIGRVLGLSARELREVEYAALLHDLGQISLRDPIPGGATVLAAPSDQLDIAVEGARIIRHAEGLEAVADYVEAQTTPYRQVREFGDDVPVASRIIKVANAFADLTGRREDPSEVAAALERIHLGLGYQYDPEVVTALAVATSDAGAGRVDDRAAVAR
ncbi:metal-dependent phosphohydrolase [Fodinibacter luteus]|uniref:Metal-dependent phosphohydrolase n=1 Tax=Fodinibacter luteus TaxID=552064 RepID=A0ABP8KNB7_9MICO